MAPQSLADGDRPTLLVRETPAVSVASLVTAVTVPTSRPLAQATSIPFAAACPAFRNSYFARFPPKWLYAPVRTSHPYADSGLLRSLGLQPALRLALRASLAHRRNIASIQGEVRNESVIYKDFTNADLIQVTYSSPYGELS